MTSIHSRWTATLRTWTIPAFLPALPSTPGNGLRCAPISANPTKVPSGLYVVGYEGLNGVKGQPVPQKPEKGLTRDVGFEARWRGLKAGLTYFATEYRDKILNRGIDDAGYSSEYYNQDGQSFINGLEGSLSFDLGEFNDWEFMLRPYLNFTKLFEYKDAEGERLRNTRERDGLFSD